DQWTFEMHPVHSEKDLCGPCIPTARHNDSIRPPGAYQTSWACPGRRWRQWSSYNTTTNPVACNESEFAPSDTGQPTPPMSRHNPFRDHNYSNSSRHCLSNNPNISD